MRKIVKAFALMACLFLAGCGNLSPRDNLSPRIDNKGQIDRVEQNQQLLRAEFEKFLNRENNNSGVQILQGDGGLVLVFGLVTIFLILYYFYRTAESYRKTAEILAEQISRADNPDLEEQVKKAAEYTDHEKRIIELLRRKK